MFCHVPTSQVIDVHDCESLYHVPLLLEKQNIVSMLQKRLNLSIPKVEGSLKLLSKWKTLASRLERLYDVVKIALVGKYTELHDSYASIIKSLEHASLACNKKLNILWIEASDLELETNDKDATTYHRAWQKLCEADGVLVPGGFGKRGTEGMIAATKYARKKNVPFLGICLGLQIAVIEFARNEMGWEGANSTELNPETIYPVVINMPEVSLTYLGGTMRLGKRNTLFVKEDSVVKKLYGGQKTISERHRHRYEVNTQYLADFEKKGLIFVGHDEKNERMEIFELKGHKFFVGTQFHPEYKTRPIRPAPVFLGFILAAVNQLETFLQKGSIELYEDGDML